ncbi:MAG: cytochrome-c peroxidase [Bacteroidetes bacterium]|nr:cytochrome-c peroxidase [Bacteroidota bacterium]
MHFKKQFVFAILAVFVLFFEYCSKEKVNNNSGSGTDTTDLGIPVLPSTALNYTISYPAYLLPEMALNDNTPADNQLTNDGATLGRVLFYDKHLSKNNTISCASCHKPTTSFTDNVRFSTGFEGGLTTRSSMDLLNVAFYKSGKMFWDERSATLEAQVVQPIQNHVEMGETFPEIVDKVKGLSYYPSLFQKAFGSTDIDSVKISRALAQFVRAIIPYQSKYDKVKQGLATFTAQEQAGENLFLNAAPPNQPTLTCAGCHKPPLFITSSPAAAFGLADAADLGINNTGTFKIGSLRNVAVTAPYFHNGSVATLQGVLTSNIPSHQVAPQDVQTLIAFMQTLTDTQTLSDERFADPFK